MSRNGSKTDKELERLLATLQPTSGRNPEAAARGRALFSQQARSMRPEASRRLEGQGRTQKKSAAAFFPARRRSPLFTTLAAVFLTILFLFGGTGITAYAAQESLPNDALYPLKTFSEDARLALESSPQGRVDLNLDFADRRINEIVSLYSVGEPVPSGVLDRLYDELDEALVTASLLQDPAMLQALEQIRVRAEAQLAVINAVMANNPGDPSLGRISVRLRQQEELTASGQSDPQGFRLQIRQQLLEMSGTATSAPETENGQPAMGTGEPQGTPVPTGGGNEQGQGGSQPTSPASERTPTPGGNGNGPGQGQGGPQNTVTPNQGGGQSGQGSGSQSSSGGFGGGSGQ